MDECGNGIEEEGESCDDGNTMDGDECPADCVVSACVPAGTTRAVDVNFQSPESLLSITLVLQYADGTVQIPGAGTDATVGARVVNRPPGFLATFVDFDFALRGTLSGSRAFASMRIFTVNFDECQDAPDVAAADFSCTVLEAANLSFQNIAGVTCSASLP
jgi:cysteine-rich repeat protein